MFITTTHKIAEDDLALPDGGLHTFSSNIAVTFFEKFTFSRKLLFLGVKQ